ncbi:MAG: hypothetical protein K6A45_02580 [Lachnospiraceae bacterium]|nr:hypothetical protein [Lachnospiraceae bacterium]
MKKDELTRVCCMKTQRSQFQQELDGKFGPKYKKWAESKIVGIRKEFDEGKICIDEDGAAYWKESGNYLHGDVCHVLSYTGYIGVDCYEKTVMAKEKQLRKGSEVMDMPRALRILDDIEAYAMKRLSGTEDVTERIRIAGEMSILQKTVLEPERLSHADGISFFNISLLRTFANAYENAWQMVGKLAEILKTVPAAV